MANKYFQTLPEQQYAFRTYFRTGKNEGLNCSDCGTYITNVIQVKGLADHQIYNLGTSCCNKISKDRTVFFTSQAEQRKKIFVKKYDEIHKAIQNLEKASALFGGIKGKFIDVDWFNYDLSLQISIFYMTEAGVLVNETIDHCQRCFSALKDFFNDFEVTIQGMKNTFDMGWNDETRKAINKLISEDWLQNNRSYGNQTWFDYATNNLKWKSDQFDNIGIANVYPEVYAELQKIKGLRFW